MTHTSPGVYSKIIDKSGYMPSSLITGYFAIAPIFSRRGEDNIIKFKYNDLVAIAEYSDPNYNKYGLPYHLALRWLKGGSSGQLCRLLPQDARYSNITLSTKPKVLPTPDSKFRGLILDGENFASGTYGIRAEKFYQNSTAGTITGFTEDWTEITNKFKTTSTYVEGDLVIHENSLFEALVSVPTNTGFKTVDWKFLGKILSASDVISIEVGSSNTLTSKANINALLVDNASDVFAVFRAIGRGNDYNSLSMTITENENLKDTYDFATYTVQFYDVDKNGFKVTAESNYTVSFDKDATDLSGESMFIADVINKYSDLFRVDVNDEKLEGKLLSSIRDNVNPEVSVIDVFNYDFLGETLETQVSFKNGSEGSLVKSNGRVDLEVRNELLIEFFTGLIDPKILNLKEISGKIVFDANYPTPVKNILSSFTDTIRPDIFALLSSGFQANEKQELDFRSNDLTIDNRAASIFINNYETYDIYSGKYIRVPSIYDVVYNVSKSFNQNGVHIAVAGYNPRGLITGLKSDTLAYNPPLAYTDQFYLKQLNPIIKDPTGTYIFGMLTTQKKASALQNMPVVNMIQVMDVELGIFSQQYLFEQLTPEVMDDLRNKIVDYFVKWFANNGVESVDVNVYATALDKKNKQIKVDIEIVPTSFIEKIFLNFIIK